MVDLVGGQRERWSIKIADLLVIKAFEEGVVAPARIDDRRVLWYNQLGLTDATVGYGPLHCPFLSHSTIDPYQPEGVIPLWLHLFSFLQVHEETELSHNRAFYA